MKVGTMELLVILLVMFLVLGPEKTVLYTRKAGKGLRTLKIYINSFTDDLKETVAEPLQELQEPLNELQKPLNEMSKAVQQPVNELNATLRESEAKLKAPPTKKKSADSNAAGTAPAEKSEEVEPLEEAVIADALPDIPAEPEKTEVIEKTEKIEVVEEAPIDDADKIISDERGEV